MIQQALIVLVALGIAGVCSAETGEPGEREKEKTAAEQPAKKASGAAETKQTPFGPAKVTAAEPPPKSELSDDPFVSAQEQGDMVVFRRKTPFGAQVWKKKKSELTADEQAILARGPQPEAKQPAAKPKAPAKAKASKSKASKKP